MPKKDNADWQKIFDDLVVLARKKLGGLPRHFKNEEDLAASAIKSYFNGVGTGKFQLPDDDGFSIRPLLSVIVARKVADLAAYLKAQKRDASRITDAEIEEIIGRETSPSLALVHEEGRRQLLEALPNDQLRRTAQWKMEGYTNKEIAEKLGCVERSVERGISLIREIWKDLASRRWEESIEAVKTNLGKADSPHEEDPA